MDLHIFTYNSFKYEYIICIPHWKILKYSFIVQSLCTLLDYIPIILYTFLLSVH